MTPDKATTHGRGCRCTPCKAEDWDAVERGIADAQATGGRTEAAAVDQAIADVERVLRWVGDGDERSRSLAALRVLADAVAERDEEIAQLRAIPAAPQVLIREERFEELRAAEAERERLKAAMHPHTAAFVLENVRLARQVADLETAHGELELHERALALMAKDFAPDLAIRDHRVLEQEYLNRAARSRDPQEPQT